MLFLLAGLSQTIFPVTFTREFESLKVLENEAGGRTQGTFPIFLVLGTAVHGMESEIPYISRGCCSPHMAERHDFAAVGQCLSGKQKY